MVDDEHLRSIAIDRSEWPMATRSSTSCSLFVRDRLCSPRPGRLVQAKYLLPSRSKWSSKLHSPRRSSRLNDDASTRDRTGVGRSLNFARTPERRELDYVRQMGASVESAKEVKIFGLSSFLIERYRTLADRLQAGPLEQISGLGPQRHVTVAQRHDSEICVGWLHSLSVEEVREQMKKVLALWAS